MNDQTKDYKKLLSNFLLIFNPYIFSFIGILLIINTYSYNFFLEPDAIKYLYIIAFIFTLIIPLVVSTSLLLLINNKLLNMSEKNKHLFQIVLLIIANYFVFTLIREHQVLFIISKYLLSLVIVAILSVFVTYFVDFSFQLVILGAFTSLTLKLNYDMHGIMIYYFFISIFLSSIIMSVQLYLKTVRNSIVYVSYIFGFIITGTFLFFYNV